MGSGAILNEVIEAGQQLAEMAIDVTIFSVTSWSELARDGAATLNNADNDTDAFITQQLHASEGPIIVATDYVRAVPESIRAFIPPGRRYQTLGTDGFGRSDTRAALRAFFKVDAASIVTAALHQLAQQNSS
jgi:pyruvate dehydrogenase E1 component